MWVKINEAYAGPLGIFIAGQKYDISGPLKDKLIKALGKGAVIPTCAPWEEKIDTKAIEANKLKAQANEAISQVEHLWAKIKSCVDHLNAYTDQAKSNKEALDKAIKHKAKNQNELHVKCKIGMGYSLIAEGELALAELELKDAEQTATELAAKAGIEFKPAGAAETKAAGNAQR